MAILLALFSALAYGLSDFVGGFLSRRTSAWAVAVVAQLSATLCTVIVATFVAGSPTSHDFACSPVSKVGLEPASSTGGSPHPG